MLDDYQFGPGPGTRLDQVARALRAAYEQEQYNNYVPYQNWNGRSADEQINLLTLEVRRLHIVLHNLMLELQTIHTSNVKINITPP